MNRDDLIDALGQMDDDMVEKVEKLRTKNRRPVWIRWAALAACIALVAAAGWYLWKHTPSADHHSISGVIQGVFVNSVLYMPDMDLEQPAAEENVGEFLGYVSYDNKKETKIKAYRYIPADEETSRIIVPHKGSYDVYTFDMYAPDGTDAWPRNLLKNAARVEIRAAGYGRLNETVYLVISDGEALDEILACLADLKVKRTSDELKLYYYGLFKDQFKEYELFINEEGNVVTGGNAARERYAALIAGEERNITVIMKDNSEITYSYKEGAGVITCMDEVKYILSEGQAKKINSLIGLE